MLHVCDYNFFGSMYCRINLAEFTLNLINLILKTKAVLEVISV